MFDDNRPTAADLRNQAFGSIPDLIAAYAHEQPDAAALVVEDVSVTYAEFDAQADRVAAALQRADLGAGDTIALCASTSPEYYAVYMGALRAGLTVAPLPSGMTVETTAAMVRDSGASRVFADAVLGDRAAAIREKTAARWIALDDTDVGEAFSGWLEPAGAKPRRVRVTPDMVQDIIYSSGTTGVPKGVAQARGTRWRDVTRGIMAPNQVTLLSTPPYTTPTLSTLLLTIAVGGTVVMMKKFDAARYLELAERRRVTFTTLVPVQLRRLMDAPEFGRFDLSSLQSTVCTSAPSTAELKAEVVRRWPGRFIELYGMTEGGITCVLDAHAFPDKLHTVGKPGTACEVRTIDDEGRELPPGSVGEVVGRNEIMMARYHNQPERTAEAEWFDAEGNRFIRTGDIGRIDEDGFMVLIGRKKDMIISGGFNIYPIDIEAVMASHPAVEEAAVVGAPSRRWGETPVAFVVLRPGKTMDAQGLLAWTNARLGKTQRLAALRLVEELPRSHIGKVLKRELREQLAEVA